MYANDSNLLINKLNKTDLKEFLYFLNSFYLQYRNNLGISKDITFGIEIEYLGVNPRKVDFYVNEVMRDWNSLLDWNSVRDASVYSGGEINSNIMCDSLSCWQDIHKICHFLKDNSASNVVDAAGGHVHIGASILTDDYIVWRKFLKLYTIFEDILYRFCYGDKINGRENIEFFAKPIGDILLFKMWRFNYAKKFTDIKDNFLSDSRSYGLNLRHVNFEDITMIPNNTIEFRFPNATVEEVILQNNINVLVKFLLATLNLNLDEGYLDKLLYDMNERVYSGDVVYNYNTINFRKSLLFADLVFDNTLDKIYFLRQYFKSFQNTNEKGLVLARKFIV